MIKFKKALLAFLVTCVLACTLIIALGSEVKAETGSRYFGLYLHSNNRPNDTYISTYCMQNDKPVIKILEYNGTTTSATVVDDNAQIYCLQAGVGFGSNNEYTGNTITEYTYYHDLKDPNGIASNYRAKLPSGDYYNEMVWVLDNMINPRDGSYTDDDTVLEAAGTSRTAFRTLNNNAQMSDAQYQNLIEAIQQCVIWYFTNRNLADGFTQKAVEETNIDDTIQTLIAGMRYGSPNGGTTAIPQLYGKIIAMDTPAGQLAYYYITQAIANKATALSSSSNSATFDKSRATTQIVGDYYYVGPYKYTGVNLSSVTITAPATYTLVKAANANAAELSGSTDKDKINGNKGTDFYIKVPLRVNGNKVSGTVSINVRATYTRKTLTYWNKTGYLDVTQPLAEITSTSATLNDTDTKDISNPEFDLALRKYITQIKAADGTVKYSSTISNRTPDIAKPPVFNLGTNNTTARKPHEKDALLIEEGDVITYKITVYNEGDINASNVVVTDYLPTGLTYQSSGSDGWTAGTASGGYTPYTLTFGNIPKYDGGNNLSSTTKTMTCKVTQTAGDSRIDLKNIAEITSASGGTDRDSNPGNLTPSSSYAPSTAEQGMGEQDDDDYEHLYLAPRVKEFDLALRKYITEIKSSTGTVKYSSTIGNRTPSITTPPTFNLDNGTTARKTHEKDALKIDSGDVITYKIAVYNEADLAGSNVVVTDYLPSGLTYQSSGSDSWTPGTASNGYTPYTLNYGTVSAYNGSALQPVIHTMVCKVTATPGDSRIDLKNIAEITSATGGTDRDSNPGNLTPSSTYAPSTAEQGKGVQDDDDYEHLYLGPLQEFDLALRKYITEIKSATGTVKYSSTIGNRTPNIATPPAFNLDNGTTATKTHEKDALLIEEGDVITYKIDVYNEADLAASNVVVTDYLPSGLTYQSSGSDSWTPGTASNGYTPYTFNYGTIAKYNGSALQPTSHTMVCKVTATQGNNRIDLKNIAEITSATGGTDRDSNPGNLTPSSTYAPSTAEQGKGVQDDDDYEHLYLEPKKEFDLAIRKYITEIKSATGTVKYSSTIGNRTPNIATPPAFNLDNGTTARKTHEKDALKVEEGDVITYKIAVYNEAGLEATNVVVTDYLPSGLTYQSSGSDSWTPGTASNGYTPYTLNYETIAAYNGTSLQPTVKTMVCKVTAVAGDNRIDLKNIAEITSAAGGTDRDSTPGTITPEPSYAPTTAEEGKGVQDDDDYEHLYVEPRVKEFDLAIRKYITEIKSADGTVKYSSTIANRIPNIGTPNFSLDNGTTAKKPHEKDALEIESGDIITYTITVYNEGEIDATEVKVTDYLPSGLTYVSGDWTPGTETDGYTPYTMDYGTISAYDNGSTLPSKSKTITCKVTATPGNDRKDLKNIVEITSATGGTDRDSNPGSITPEPSYAPTTAEEGKGVQDDDDYEHIYLDPEVHTLIIDLALRKYITTIKTSNGQIKFAEDETMDGGPIRFPSITTPPTFSLDNGTTAKKTHSKTPMKVQTGDLVTYRISIYNEGNALANNVTVTDYIPEGLEVVSEGWTKGTTNNGYTAYTKTYPSVPAATANALGVSHDEIICKVVATSGNTKISLKNIAEITTFDGDDRDSEPGTITPGDDYNPTNPEEGKGIQDDDDFEEVVIEPNTFDLALKKFIASVNNEELKTNGVYDRAPSVDTSKRNGTTVTSFTYTFASNKTPIKVVNNDIIKYVIRVYNEGGADGYAKQIKDDIPKGLIFLPDNKTNTDNGWYMLDSSGNKTTDVNKAVSVVTDEYGFGQSKARLLKAFDPDTMANNPDYFDVEIAFKVGQPEKNNIDRIVINSAEISKNSDDEGNEIPDIDSKVNNMTPGKPKEDDEDIENIYIKYFDLSLKKWTTQAIVIEDGKQTTKNTGHKPTDNPEALVKVEVNKKRIESTVIKFKYTIRVTNEGEIDGAATEISEYVPDGLKFNASDNPDWKQVNGKVVTTKLKDKILKPGEYADVDITLTWVNSANNVKAMNNIAEISEDYNESGTPDADSTPNNKKSNEDDQDDAPVIVTMVTGVKPSYLALTGAVLSIIVTGAALLKKYVLS